MATTSTEHTQQAETQQILECTEAVAPQPPTDIPSEIEQTIEPEPKHKQQIEIKQATEHIGAIAPQPPTEVTLDQTIESEPNPNQSIETTQVPEITGAVAPQPPTAVILEIDQTIEPEPTHVPATQYTPEKLQRAEVNKANPVEPPPELLHDDINFPQLGSPSIPKPQQQQSTTYTPQEATPRFVWQPKPKQKTP